MKPETAIKFNENVDTLLKFHSKEKLTINGYEIEYGSVVYKNAFFEMLGCVLWKGHYFTLERGLWDKKGESILFGEFYGNNHFTYYSKSIGIDKENMKNSLIEFVKEYLEESK